MEQRLKLDEETILNINEALTLLSEGHRPEDVHGRMMLEIVQGRFQLVEITGSFLLIKNRRKKTA